MSDRAHARNLASRRAIFRRLEPMMKDAPLEDSEELRDLAVLLDQWKSGVLSGLTLEFPAEESGCQIQYPPSNQMFNGDTQLGEQSLEQAHIQTREVLVPVFLKVSVPLSESPEHAEWKAVEIVRTLPSFGLVDSASVELHAVISPLCK